MSLVHDLPGTTFSDVGQRGSYDSDKAACLTLDEVERWLATAVAKYYHQHPHEGLDGQTPLRRWQDGVTALLAEGGSIPVPRDPRAYLVDFLPSVAPQPAAQRDYDRSSDLLQLRPACLDYGARSTGSIADSAEIRATSAAYSCSTLKMMVIWKCPHGTCRGRPSHFGSTVWRDGICGSATGAKSTRQPCSRRSRKCVRPNAKPPA